MSSARNRWSAVLLSVLVIYTTVPFVRGLREWFIERWGAGPITWLVAATLVAVVAGSAVGLRRASVRLRQGALPWLAAITGGLLFWTFQLRRSPEEAVHILEYGALAILLYRALRPSIPDALVFVVGALVGACAGTLDEIIQWLSPDRFWDWRDIALNAGSGAAVQLALWRILPQSSASITSSTARLTLRWTAALVLMLTLCLANTPRVVAWYAPLLPGGGRLMSTHNPMAEYGYLHRVPGVGSFKSRLDLDAITQQDRSRAAEAAAAVDAARRRYGRFLDTWPVARDPFTYELRVHLFARDRNLARARERDFTGSVARQHLNIAWCENTILETHFGRSLEASSYPWKEELSRRVALDRDSSYHFRSAVARHLITFASEGAIRATLLTLAALLIAFDLALGRSQRGRS